MAIAANSDAEAIETGYRILHALVDARQQHRRRPENDELAAADTIAIDYWRNVIATKLRQSQR